MTPMFAKTKMHLTLCSDREFIFISFRLRLRSRLSSQKQTFSSSKSTEAWMHGLPHVQFHGSSSGRTRSGRVDSTSPILWRSRIFFIPINSPARPSQQNWFAATDCSQCMTPSKYHRHLRAKKSFTTVLPSRDRFVDRRSHCLC